MSEENLWGEARLISVNIGVFIRDCVLIELVLPMSPLLILWALKEPWPALGVAAGYGPALVISAVMLPLVLFIRSHGASRYLFVSLMMLGTILYAMSLLIESKVWPGSRATEDLSLCYLFSGSGLLFSGTLRFLSGLGNLGMQLAKKAPGA